MVEDRKLLYDASLEKHMLGWCIDNNKVLEVFQSMITPEAFFFEGNRQIYQAMCEIAKGGRGFDVITVHSKVKTKFDVPPAYIVSLTDHVFSGVDRKMAEEAAEQLMNYHSMRSYRLFIERERGLLSQSVGDAKEATARIRGLLDDIEKLSTEAMPMTPLEGVELILENARKAMSGEESVQAVNTGYKRIDSLFGGFKKGELIVTAGRPGMGKTALGVGITYNVAKQGVPVLFVSYEMKEADLFARAIGLHFDMGASNLRMNSLSDELESSLKSDVTFKHLPMYVINVSGLNVDELQKKVRNYVMKYGIGLVIVDYLQLIKDGKGLQGEEAVAKKSLGLKTMAMENDVPVISLAQLSRATEARELKRPRLEDLKGSGAIEADADAVILLYRPGYYQIDQIGSEDVSNKIKLIVAKFRDGKPNDIVMAWNDGRIADEDTDLPF